MRNRRRYALICIVLFFASSLQVRAQDLTKPPTSYTRQKFENYVQTNAPSEDAFVAVQRLASAGIQEKQWQQATGIFATYRPLFPGMDTRFQKIIDLLEKEGEGLIRKNLGAGINTEHSEYTPTPSADGTEMYFTGNGRPDGLGREDMFVSVLKDGVWQPAVNLGKDINSGSAESVSAISADGNIISLFGNYSQSLGRGDSFFCERTQDGWGPIQHFPAPINSKHFDSDAMITSDGQALIFMSERPGGVGDYHERNLEHHGDYWGNIDIYVCNRTEAGWSAPINLGPMVNTPYCEYTPFLHPDGKTLYFSSDGHYGLGFLDVFKATRLTDTSWTQWSEPINLGKEINSADDDWGYKVATSGDIAYFSALNRPDGYGKNGIYSITLPQIARAEAVVTIKGKVIDENNDPLPANIKWEDLSIDKVVGELKTNPNDGAYFIVLPLGKNYGYFASLDGYYPVSRNIDLRDSTRAFDLQNDIQMVSIQEMQEKALSVKINNVFFEYDQHELKRESYSELNRLADVLMSNSDLQVEIAGHTDSVGTEAYNQQLSERRAEAVVDYLVQKKNYDRKNLTVIGYGESSSIASNDTEEGRAANRRVEFRFLKDVAAK